MKKKINTLEKLKEKFTPLIIFLILGLFIVEGAKIYRKTFIDWYLLFIPVFLGPILFSLKAKSLTGESEKIQAMIMTFIYVAPISFYLFLAINYYLGSKKTIVKTFEIIKKGEAVGGRSHKATPYSVIVFEQKNKQLFFPKCEEREMYKAKKIAIEFHKGLLGYFVIDRHEFK